jgi:hypothetical protein
MTSRTTVDIPWPEIDNSDEEGNVFDDDDMDDLSTLPHGSSSSGYIVATPVEDATARSCCNLEWGFDMPLCESCSDESELVRPYECQRWTGYHRCVAAFCSVCVAAMFIVAWLLGSLGLTDFADGISSEWGPYLVTMAVLLIVFAVCVIVTCCLCFNHGAAWLHIRHPQCKVGSRVYSNNYTSNWMRMCCANPNGRSF